MRRHNPWTKKGEIFVHSVYESKKKQLNNLYVDELWKEHDKCYSKKLKK